jgi:DNA-directed RNA polymerase subunit RPC12/RpoP
MFGVFVKDSSFFSEVHHLFSFLKILKPKRCHACRRPFVKPQEVDRGDEIAANKALLDGAFKCLKCSTEFHGKCGKIGQVTRKYASVKCPRCGQMQKLSLPFKFVSTDEVKSGGSKGDYFDKVEEQIL